MTFSQRNTTSARCRRRLKRKAPPKTHQVCPFCQRHMIHGRTSPVQKARQATIDHILPRSRGGTHDAENLRWCCQNCNVALGHLGGCAGALACAYAVTGLGTRASEVARWWNRSRPQPQEVRHG